MDNNFFKQLCDKENMLVEKLKVLRDFKVQFFTEGGLDVPLDESPVKAIVLHEQNISVKPKIDSSKFKANKPKLTISNKVLNALSILGTGKTKDVSDKMIELYDEYKNNPQKAIADARYHISDLKQSGVIKVVEDGLGSAGKTYEYYKS